MTAPADLRELLDLGSATAYEASGLSCALPPAFRPAWIGARRAAPRCPSPPRRATTCRCTGRWRRPARGNVLVVDASGSEHGYWGEVLATLALHRGVAGLVIDGGVRDTDRLRELGSPTFSTSISILGTGKSWPGRVGGAVHLRGHLVERGDLVVADAIAVLPRAEVMRVLDAARARAAKDAIARDDAEAARTAMAEHLAVVRRGLHRPRPGHRGPERSPARDPS